MSQISYFLVFGNGKSHPFQHLLKHGFKHCFILIRYRDIWIFLENNYNKLSLNFNNSLTADDMQSALSRLGCLMVEVNPCLIQSNKKLSFMTCVAISKRVLGINKRFIMTPWQLYCYIKRIKIKQKY